MMGGLNCDSYFYPRSPCGERLPQYSANCNCHIISIHALLAESDVDTLTDDVSTGGFLSTLSLRRATGPMQKGQVYYIISIHALLAESDTPTRTPTGCACMYFYPRSPCGERRRHPPLPARHAYFYPRSPCGERLVSRLADMSAAWNHFYPRSPCGERRCDGRPQSGWTNISIHALLAESDLAGLGCNRLHSISIHALLAESDHYGWSWYDDFTISIHALLAESDPWKGSSLFRNMISIHALLAESDAELIINVRKIIDFYPRSPCGERHEMALQCAGTPAFLSTLSLRRATTLSDCQL